MSWDITSFTNIWGNPDSWPALVLLASFTIFIIYTIVYMIARGFKSEALEKIAVSEMLHAIFSIILAVSIISILSTAFTFAINNIIGSGSSLVCDAYGKISITDAGPIEAIRCKLSEKASILSNLYEEVYRNSRESFNEFYASWGLLGIPIYYQCSYIWQSEPGTCYKEMENYRFLNSVITTLLIGLNGYLAAIDYVANNMLSMFLPIGLVLRAIPFTRGIGAFFISLAIGLYIIYPILFFITDPTFVKIKAQSYPELTKDEIGWPWPSFKGAVAMATLGPQLPTATRAYNMVSIPHTGEALASLYYFFIIHPIVILSITVVIMRYLTYLFGGEGQELYRLASRVI